jgi:hypothetical protein
MADSSVQDSGGDRGYSSDRKEVEAKLVKEKAPCPRLQGMKNHLADRRIELQAADSRLVGGHRVEEKGLDAGVDEEGPEEVVRIDGLSVEEGVEMCRGPRRHRLVFNISTPFTSPIS